MLWNILLLVGPNITANMDRLTLLLHRICACSDLFHHMIVFG